MKYRLELNNISKSFGDVHANKNINLQEKKVKSKPCSEKMVQVKVLWLK